MVNFLKPAIANPLVASITAFTFTTTLCGLFLWFVPLPGCQVAGGWLLSSGVSILGGDVIKRWDDYDKEQRKKDK